MSVTEMNDETASPSTDEFVNGLWKQNPVFVQALGMCSVLAVSNTAVNALAMGLATMTVLVLSNLAVSLLRNQIPKEEDFIPASKKPTQSQEDMWAELMKLQN